MKKILRESGLFWFGLIIFPKMKGRKRSGCYVAVYFSRSSLQQLITHTHLIQGEINFFMNASGEPIDMKDERLSSSIPNPHSLLNS